MADIAACVASEPCPDCDATTGAPCDVRVNGQPMVGWAHDSRILAPVLREISRRHCREPKPT